ncbi:enoyl-CoA hydratase-related protein [Mucilaginibacter koreensis]
MTFENLRIEDKERIRYIIINRESKLNALNKATLNELHDAMLEAIKDVAIGGIVITGSGTRAFVAGADIAELAGLNISQGDDLARTAQTRVFNFIEKSPKPVVAAINGFALGGGLELAMACHIRVASENAKMGLPEVSLGLIPGYGGTQRLTHLVGKGKAMEMILTGAMVTATEAHTYGLVNYAVSSEELLPKAEELLGKMLAHSPAALSSAITAINAAHKPVNGFETEINLFANCFGTDDMKEGTAAFLQKRKPNFTGG